MNCAANHRANPEAVPPLNSSTVALFTSACLRFVSCLTERSCLPYGKAPLLLSRSVKDCASVPLPHRAAFGYSSHRGGVGPGDCLSFNFCDPDGSFIEPPRRRTTPASADRHRRTAKDRTPETIFETGRRTLEARPPAMWFKASNMTTIRPSDQRMSISLLSPLPGPRWKRIKPRSGRQPRSDS